MNIQIDSRKKARVVTKIIHTFDKIGVSHFVSKLYVGNYMSYDNLRSVRRTRDKTGQWINVPSKAMQGETLYKILRTMERKYGCQFLFCEKKDTGRRIVELLGGGMDD